MMATKKSVHTLGEADLRGKKVLVRTNLDVPLDSRSHQITDDHRIVASVETIKFFQEKGARVILASHLGHPKGVNPHYSLKHLVPHLSEILQVHVEMANDCIGVEVTEQVRALSEGGVLLLENVRFYKEEERNSDILADKLASLADIYVNDDFGTAHKAHASTEGVAKVFKHEVKPAIVGLHMQKELGSLGYLGGAVDNRPLVAIVGGSESNIGIIEPLLAKIDILILGGEMIYTFYKAQKYSVGKSTVQEDKLELAASLIEKAKANAVSFLLPTDILVAKKLEANAKTKTVPATAIPDNWKGIDVGPNSIRTFNEALDNAQTVIWDGVMGVSEFVTIGGTDNDKKIAEKLAELKTEKGVTVIIGGGSAAAVNKAGLGDKMSYISTGGGAIWEILGGKTLPGVIGLDDA